jgi:hypothetical protein
MSCVRCVVLGVGRSLANTLIPFPSCVQDKETEKRGQGPTNGCRYIIIVIIIIIIIITIIN